MFFRSRVKTLPFYSMFKKSGCQNIEKQIAISYTFIVVVVELSCCHAFVALFTAHLFVLLICYPVALVHCSTMVYGPPVINLPC